MCAQTVDAFGNKGLTEVCQIHKSLLEREKEAGESKAHAPIKSPTRSEKHMQCVPLDRGAPLLTTQCVIVFAPACAAAHECHAAMLLECRSQGEAWGNQSLWEVQKPHKSKLELEKEAWLKAVLP